MKCPATKAPVDPDPVVIEKVPEEHRPTLGLSLRPNESVMDDYIAKKAHAIAIIEAWRFRAPVRVVTPEEYAAMNHGVAFVAI